MTARFEAYSLGATLYMPIIHPKVPAFLSGQAPCPASSVVLCLEDALAEYDVARGLATLRALPSGDGPVPGLRVFVRPRSLNMARDLAGYDNIHRFEGFVAPKVRPETAADWLELAQAIGLRIMPTLESAEFFDPMRIGAVRDAFNAYDSQLISAIRLGGNDLLGALALRRERGSTSWEGPLGWVLSMAASMLVSAGYPVAAPVFDIIEDIETLKREVRRDVAAGFVSKTAIHPSQVPHIEAAMRVTPADLEQANAILCAEARAVFRMGDVMCEPSTHRGWAERTLARARIFGIQGDPEMRDAAPQD